MNLLEAATIFADESGRIRTPESRRSFMKVMRHLNRWAGGEASGVPIAELSARDLTDWCLSETQFQTPPAPATIKKRRAHVKSLFGWCKWRGIIDNDPTPELDWSVNPGSGQVRTHTWLTEEQASEILGFQPKTIADERNQLIILLGVMCGLRAGVEMADLSWEQLNEDFTELTLVGKGNKLSVIGVPDQVAEALRSWHRRRPIGAKVLLPRMRPVWDPGRRKSTWMIDWSKPLGYDGILQAVKRVGEPHGVRLRPHDLRRSFAGILEAQGVPLNDISMAMRHENVATTSRYLDRNPAKRKAVGSQFRIG